MSKEMLFVESEILLSTTDITIKITSAIELKSVAAEQINKEITTISGMSHKSEIYSLEAVKLSNSLLKRLAGSVKFSDSI